MRNPTLDRRCPGRLRRLTAYAQSMPKIHVDEDTVERLDNLRVEDESYDEIVNELINIYEAEELTLFHGGDYSGD